MKRRQRFWKVLRYTAYTLTVNWAIGLVVFFHDPEWAKEQFEHYFGFVEKQTPFIKPITCKEYESVAWTLNDSVEQYWKHSSEHGIKEPRFVRDVRSEYRKGNLVLIEPNERFNVDTMYYSYAFTTPKTRVFIDTLMERFQSKLVNTDLYGVKLTLTSLLRTHSSVERLRKRNRNAIKHTAHLHGTTFDISYATYDFKRPVTPAEAQYLREVLAKTLLELRSEKKCWVTYEIYQTCFHVVTC